MFIMKRSISTKSFKKVSINTLTTIAYPNFRNNQNIGPRHLGNSGHTKSNLTYNAPYPNSVIDTNGNHWCNNQRNRLGLVNLTQSIVISYMIEEPISATYIYIFIN